MTGRPATPHPRRGGSGYPPAVARARRILLGLGVGAVATACFALPDGSEYVHPDSMPDGATLAAGDGAPASVSADVGAAKTTPDDDAGPDDAGPAASDAGGQLVCGGNGVDGDVGTLYRVVPGAAPVVAQVCDKGCEWTAGASGDCCRTSTNCCCGSGMYCGNDGLPGDPTVLFDCQRDRIDPVTRCDAGCLSESSGVDDRCK